VVCIKYEGSGIRQAEQKTPYFIIALQSVNTTVAVRPNCCNWLYSCRANIIVDHALQRSIADDKVLKRLCDMTDLAASRQSFVRHIPPPTIRASNMQQLNSGRREQSSAVSFCHAAYKIDHLHFCSGQEETRTNRPHTHTLMQSGVSFIELILASISSMKLTPGLSR
jgi:hypothetical protein